MLNVCACRCPTRCPSSRCICPPPPQGPEEIIQQITDTVYPMYKAFIEPDLATAQIRIYNHFNPFTGFMNATYILKSAKVREAVR